MKKDLLVTTAIPDLLQNIFRDWCVGPGLMTRKPSSLYGRMLQYDKTSRWYGYIKDSIEHTKYIFRKTEPIIVYRLIRIHSQINRLQTVYNNMSDY